MYVYIYSTYQLKFFQVPPNSKTLQDSALQSIMDMLLEKWGEPAASGDAAEGVDAAPVLEGADPPPLPEHPPLLEQEDEDEERPRDLLPFDVYDTIELDDTQELQDVEGPQEVSADQAMDEAKGPKEVSADQAMDEAEGPQEVSADQAMDEAEGPQEVSTDQAMDEAEGPQEVSTDHVMEAADQTVESPRDSIFTPEEQAALNNALRYFFPSPEKVSRKLSPEKLPLESPSTATPSPIAVSSTPPVSEASASSDASDPRPKTGLAVLAAKRARLQELKNLV